MATQTQAPPLLSFPRPIFAAISPSPFLHAHLAASGTSKSHRANGRLPTEFRKPAINTGSLTHCNASAVVRQGNTAVVCGVRAEILRAEDVASPPAESADEEDDRDEIEGLRLLVPNLELATGSAPSHLPGQAPSSFAQTLITRIRSQLLSTRMIRASDLRIKYTPSRNAQDDAEMPDVEIEEEVKGYWVLYIDTMFISLDGNAFDTAFLAILAALRTTVLPRAFYDEELERILCSDDPAEAKILNLRGLPIPSTFAVFEGKKEASEDEGAEKGDDSWVLSDPDAFEEGVCAETVTVVVDAGVGKAEGQVRRIEKSGGGVMDREVMRGAVKRALERWGVVEGVLKEQG